MLVRRIFAPLAFGAAFAASAVVACGSFGGVDPPAGPPDGSTSGDGGGSEAAADDAAKADGAQPCSPDLTTDSKNCGACGHDCKAGCFGSICAPESIPLTKTPLGPGAHVAADGDAGALADGLDQVGGGSPGFVYGFDPTSAAPTPSPLRTAQRNASHIVVHGTQIFWTHTLDTILTNTGESKTTTSNGGQFDGLAISSAGTYVAAHLVISGGGSSAVTVYDADLGFRRTIDVSTGAGVVFPTDDTVVVGKADGIHRCTATGSDPCIQIAMSAEPVTAVAVAKGLVFFTTQAGVLRSATLPGPSFAQVLETGFVKPSAVAADGAGAVLVLDSKGLHTTRYGARIPLVLSAKDAVLSFALSGPWVYFVTPKGLFRVRY